MGKIKAISVSERKGVRKDNRNYANLIPDFGLEGDAHGGKWHRQVSFLAQESIDIMCAKGLEVVAGNFAENITTIGVDLHTLAVGNHVKIGESELLISQLGKICHTPCAIYHQAGDCVMPRDGIFAVVRRGGNIRVGDSVEIDGKTSPAAAIISNRKTATDLGEELRRRVLSIVKPAFIRFDTIGNKQGENITDVLKDLIDIQKIKDIIIFDPLGDQGSVLVGYPLHKNQPNTYVKNGSTISYYRNLDDLKKI